MKAKKLFLILLILLCICGCSEKKESKEIETEIVEEKKKETFDVDISFGSDTIAYATLENVKENKDDYLGKTFKMKGEFRKFYSEYTGTTYCVCIIWDPTGCCSLGMEFYLDDGEEYPMDGINIIVQGTIDVYEEGTDSFLYLKDASWKPC